MAGRDDAAVPIERRRERVALKVPRPQNIAFGRYGRPGKTRQMEARLLRLIR